MRRYFLRRGGGGSHIFTTIRSYTSFWYIKFWNLLTSYIERRPFPCTHPPACAASCRRCLPCWPLLSFALPRARAASLENRHGIQMLAFDEDQILSIGNQAPGQCSLYALRYARTVLDGAVSSGAGMWSNGAVWSAAGYTGFAGDLDACLDKLLQ